MAGEAAEAHARSRAYALFSDLVRRGIRPDNLDEVATWPELVEAAEDLSSEVDFDLYGTRHHRLFDLNVHPFEGVFLDAASSPTGERLAAVSALYPRVGFGWDPTKEGADHFGVELAALSYLSGAEADAMDDADEDSRTRVRTAASQVLGQLVLPWFPVLKEAVLAHADPLFDRVFELCDELLVDHVHALELQGVEGPPLDEPSLADLLAESQTSLRDVVDHLLTPRCSGLLFTTERIRRAGRTQEVPGGFGSRARVLDVTLRSAADYGALPAVADALRAEVELARSRVELWGADWPNPLRSHAAAWKGRLVSTIDGLGRLGRAST